MFGIPNGTLIQLPKLTPQQNLNDKGAYSIYPATSLPRRGRIVTFQSYGDGGEGQWTGPAFTALTTPAQSDGWEIIEIHRPIHFVDGAGQGEGYFDIRDDPAFGARFMHACVDFADATLDVIEAKHGKLPIVYGGLSMGAWQTLQMVLNAKHRPIGYFAIMPPSIFNLIAIFNLPLYPPAIFPNTSGMDLSDTCLNAVAIPGYVAYGSEDAWVLDEHIATMALNAIAAGSPLQGNRSTSDGVITGGTSYSSATCGLALAESGAVITGPGIPSGTTISVTSGALPYGGGGGFTGPYTATLSKTCTNGSGLTVTFPGLCPVFHQPHGMFQGDGVAAALYTWLVATLDAANPQVY
jgi:hypothetical protein